MPRLVEVEDLPEFIKRHGGNPLKVGGTFLFEDGATCNETGMVKTEPSPNVKERYIVQRDYLKEKLKNLVNDLNGFVSYCESQTGFIAKGCDVPPPPPESPEIVKQYRKDIQALEARIADLETKITPAMTYEQIQRQNNVHSVESRKNEALRLRDQVRQALHGED